MMPTGTGASEYLTYMAGIHPMTILRWSDHFEDVRVLQPGPEGSQCTPPPPKGAFSHTISVSSGSQ